MGWGGGGCGRNIRNRKKDIERKKKKEGLYKCGTVSVHVRVREKICEQYWEKKTLGLGVIGEKSNRER